MAKENKKNDTVSDEIAEIRRKRREDAEKLLQEQKEELNQREEFRKFFARISGSLKLNRDMEHVIWLHFKAAGFDKVEKFEEGISHFGYKL